MAIYTNLPIYNASFELLREFCRLMPGMPRDCRYTLGQDTRHTITKIIILIYRANKQRNKLEVITSMRESLLEVQVYMRLMMELHYLSQKSYMALAERTQSMSKQMSAWEKSERERLMSGGGRQ